VLALFATLPELSDEENVRRSLQGFDCCRRIQEMTRPTLIQHGGADRLLPVENALTLGKRIPHSRLAIYTGLGHLFLMEDPDTTNADVQRFIQESSAIHQ
jgi:pimeloyl-ACP methyl ester carboxylesterase